MKTTAVIQQISKQSNGYQLLFQNVVSASGMVLVGLNVTEDTIRNMDLRIDDTIAIDHGPNGMFVTEVITRNKDSEPFFEPEPENEYVAVLIGPISTKKSQVNLAKTIPLTIRGVLRNAGLENAQLNIAIDSDMKNTAMSDAVASIKSMCTHSA